MDELYARRISRGINETCRRRPVRGQTRPPQTKLTHRWGEIADLRLPGSSCGAGSGKPGNSVQAPLPQKRGFFGAPAAPISLFIIVGYLLKKWSGRMDLNHRPPGPEPGALARLLYAPTDKLRRIFTAQAGLSD